MTRPVSDRNTLRFPSIPRLSRELRQQGQLDYLLWRLDMYLKDHGCPRADRRKWMDRVKEIKAQGASYEVIVQLLEDTMRAHFTNQLRQVQAIFNERTD